MGWPPPTLYHGAPRLDGANDGICLFSNRDPRDQGYGARASSSASSLPVASTSSQARECCRPRRQDRGASAEAVGQNGCLADFSPADCFRRG